MKTLVVVLVATGVALAGVGTAAAIGGQDTATSDVATQVTASSATATANANARSASATDVSAGQTVTVTLSVTGNGDTPSIEESFSPEFESVKITSVKVNGSAASPFLETADSTGVLTTFQNSVDDGAPIEITYEVTVPANATTGQNFTIDTRSLTNTQESSVDSTVLTVSENEPPVADAGADITTTDGDSVVLTAGASSDPDGDPLEFSWTQTDGPSVSLSNASAKSPSFTAPSVSSSTTLTFSVEVADDKGASGSATVNVTVEPANASGPTRSVPSSISPGGTGTVTVETNATGSAFTLSEAFSPSFESASVESVKVNGNTVSPFLSPADPNGTTVTLQSVNAGDQITVTYEVTVSSDASIGDVYSVSGDVTSDDTVSLGTDRIAVEESQDPQDKYDTDGDGIDVTELGTAASDYVRGDLSIQDLGALAAAYVQNQS